MLSKLEEIKARVTALRLAKKTYSAAQGLDITRRRAALDDLNDALQIMDQNALDDLAWCISRIEELEKAYVKLFGKSN